MSEGVAEPPFAGPIPEPPAPALTPVQARDLARWNLKHGAVFFSGHALKRMDEQKPPLAVEAVRSAIYAGEYLEPEIQNGEWRYRATTQKIRVVLAFDQVTRSVVCTAFRIGRGWR